MRIKTFLLLVFSFSSSCPAQEAPIPSPGPEPLYGYVDLHTHPLANVGFGGKLLYGGVDIGALLPADPNCKHNVRATTMEQALGHDQSTHGMWTPFNQCGDTTRMLVIHAVQKLNKAADETTDAHGAPDFEEWPVWNDLTHQKMWVDWIERAHKSGLRVMVALGLNNKTLADATAGQCDYPTDDRNSADLQLAEIKGFVDRHPKLMEIALTPADLERIVSKGKLAIVLGVEVDNIGNLNNVPQPPSNAQISAEIDRLYRNGVRYIFPIHVLDNPFGGTATYQDLFNFSTFREDGHYWDLWCAPTPDNPSEAINYQFSTSQALEIDLLNIASKVKLSTSFPDPPPYPCAPPMTKVGQTNKEGLTDQGRFAIKEMMRHGMIIDIDHMSDASKNMTIDIAKKVGSGYPLNSGHAGLRGYFAAGVKSEDVNDRSMSASQYLAIADLHGMAGIGSGNLDAYQWAEMYQRVVELMKTKRKEVSAGFGTDTDGFAPGMPPRCDPPIDPSDPSSTCKTPLATVKYDDSFPISKLGSQTWNYNLVGVAHYGMLADFLQDVKSSPTDKDGVLDKNLMGGAEYFYQTWKICEAQKVNVK
jgi:microsomal dipeptidase-like Zn-dependent dipeptidase